MDGIGAQHQAPDQAVCVGCLHPSMCHCKASLSQIISFLLAVPTQLAHPPTCSYEVRSKRFEWYWEIATWLSWSDKTPMLPPHLFIGCIKSGESQRLKSHIVQISCCPVKLLYIQSSISPKVVKLSNSIQYNTHETAGNLGNFKDSTHAMLLMSCLYKCIHTCTGRTSIALHVMSCLYKCIHTCGRIDIYNTCSAILI